MWRSSRVGQSPEKPLAVSLCEVKAHPESFLHKLIEFTATASHGLKTRWSRTVSVRGQTVVRVSGWSMGHAINGYDVLLWVFPKSQIEQKLLQLMGCRWIWWTMRPSKSSTSDYIHSTRSQNEGPTLSGLLCVAEYLQGTKALGEHSRILAGEGMGTWGAAVV